MKQLCIVLCNCKSVILLPEIHDFLKSKINPKQEMLGNKDIGGVKCTAERYMHKQASFRP